MATSSDRWKGYMLALIATLAMSNVYLFSKAALNLVHLFQFGIYWFGFAILLNFVYLLITGKVRTISKLPLRNLPILVIIGLLETIGTALFFMAIHTVENPANVSFLANLTPLFVTLLGITFLRERFTGIEVVGIILTISGAFVLSYQPGHTGNLFMKGAGLVLLSSTLFSVSLTIAKKNIMKFDAGLLSLNRVIFLFLFMLSGLLITRHSLIIPSRALINIALGSSLGPFLTALAQYSSFRFIEASRSTLIQSSKGIFVLLGALLLFRILPGAIQLAGGLLTVIGVLFITLGKQGGRLLSSGRRNRQKRSV